MIAPRSRRRDGLTLIEILLALIVMVLGFCGILALFPPALQSSRESMEATNAALLGESVAHALTTALRFAQFNAASQQHEAILTHDLRSGATTNRYRFALPKLAAPGDPLGGWRHYPSKVNPPSPDPGAPMTAAWAPEEDDRLFTLDGDPWLKETVRRVHEINDASDPYGQFAFSFQARKADHLAYLRVRVNPDTGRPYTNEEIDKQSLLYEFRIHVFRVTPAGDARKLIATITKKIALK